MSGSFFFSYILFFLQKKKKKKNQFIVTNTDVSDPNCWEPSLLWPAAVCSRLILLKNNYKSSIPFFSTKITGGGEGINLEKPLVFGYVLLSHKKLKF